MSFISVQTKVAHVDIITFDMYFVVVVFFFFFPVENNSHGIRSVALCAILGGFYLFADSIVLPFVPLKLSVMHTFINNSMELNPESRASTIRINIAAIRWRKVVTQPYRNGDLFTKSMGDRIPPPLHLSFFVYVNVCVCHCCWCRFWSRWLNQLKTDVHFPCPSQIDEQMCANFRKIENKPECVPLMCGQHPANNVIIYYWRTRIAFRLCVCRWPDTTLASMVVWTQKF